MSFLAGLATVLGALMVLVTGRPTERLLAFFLGMASGIMLGVVVLDLIPASLSSGTPLALAFGLLAGWWLLKILGWILGTRTHPAGPRDNFYLLRMGYLVAVGIALHDLPEGMAIAVGYATTVRLGWVIAFAIGLHNVPEGMATAAPLLMGGLSPLRIFALAGLVSLFTPLGSLLGILLVQISGKVISFLLALAGGAMLFVVMHEIWPESVKRHPNYSRLGAFWGLVIVLILTFLE